MLSNTLDVEGTQRGNKRAHARMTSKAPEAASVLDDRRAAADRVVAEEDPVGVVRTHVGAGDCSR